TPVPTPTQGASTNTPTSAPQNTNTPTPTQPSISGTTFRIQSLWQPAEYLYDTGSQVNYGSGTSTSYQWVIEDISGESFKRIRNVGTGNYMHIENLLAYVQTGALNAEWYSMRWTVAAESNYYRFQNAWQGGNYIHVENQAGYAQQGGIDMGWDSAKWYLVAVSSSATSTPTRTPTPAAATATPTRTATPAPTATPPPSGSGNGLSGAYYNNMDFTSLALTRTDSTVNFNWGTGSPNSAIDADTFSVIWTGNVVPLYSQTYTFYATTDDGVRLYVNNQLIIDQWVDRGATESSGNISLSAGNQYPIRMEYYENGGDASATLSWSSSSQGKQIIPQSQLYSSGAAATSTPTNAPAATATPVPTATPSSATPTPTRRSGRR
ncbi:MAG: hypothetical protein JW969_20605, partial [Spirochaetales bacterium]|nr:hypothetical protein [Spirochaetales bacterium]